jgi:hypothetical protein
MNVEFGMVAENKHVYKPFQNHKYVDDAKLGSLERFTCSTYRKMHNVVLWVMMAYILTDGTYFLEGNHAPLSIIIPEDDECLFLRKDQTVICYDSEHFEVAFNNIKVIFQQSFTSESWIISGLIDSVQKICFSGSEQRPI